MAKQVRRDSDCDSMGQSEEGASNGGSTGGSTKGDEGARTQVIMGNKRKWLISQLCKSVDLMKRDLLVVSLAPHDAPLSDTAWQDSVPVPPVLDPETCAGTFLTLLSGLNLFIFAHRPWVAFDCALSGNSGE